MADATTLYQMCAELLAACEDALTLSPGGPIARAYVAPGPPAFDCEQLTVHAGGPTIQETAPLQPLVQQAHRVTQTGILSMLTMTVTVVRYVPCNTVEGETLIIPPVADLDAASQVTMADAWAIWNHLATLKREETLFPPKRREFVIDPAFPVNTQGGIAGWQLQFRAQIDGFDTTTAAP